MAGKERVGEGSWASAVKQHIVTLLPYALVFDGNGHYGLPRCWRVRSASLRISSWSGIAPMHGGECRNFDGKQISYIRQNGIFLKPS
jgi:hypothetical protein